MATDLAIDYNTGDLKVSPRGSFDVRTGPATIEQRIRVRLRVGQGMWVLDPTNGTLGSRIAEVFRLPSYRAAGELELVIREALEPMDDITVQDVDVHIDPKTAKTISATIYYVINDEGEGADIQTIQTDFTTGG